MTQQVTVYRWDDVGAPQVVDGRPSEYIEIFKKCLVEGYGTKQPLGWTIAEEVANPPFIAFQNNIASGGSGGTVMMEAPGNAIRETIRVQSALDFAGQGSFSRAGFFFGFNAASTNANYQPRNWILIGTATAFYFFAFSPIRATYNYQGTITCVAFFVGDINSIYPNDTGRFTAMSGVKNSTSFSWSYNLNYKIVDTTPNNVAQFYPLDGSGTPSEMDLVHIFGDQAASTLNDTFAAEPEIKMLSPLYFVSRDNFESSPYLNDTTSPHCRGILPGFFVSQEAGYRDVGYQPFIKAIGSQQYMQLPSSHSSRCSCLWLNLEEW
tara:strand:+ start:46728 stop:47693 length:966 start_codon:yes stop_codon:yes gene_type:complete